MKVELKSSNIKTVEFFPAEHAVNVEFTTGVTHRYDGITQEVYNAWMDAPSKGSYFATHIRNVLPNKRLPRS